MGPVFWTEPWTFGGLQGRRAVSCDGNMKYDGCLEFDRKQRGAKRKQEDSDERKQEKGWERIHIKLDFICSVRAERFAHAHVHYRCVVFGTCAGTAEHGPLRECLHTCPFLACASMCIIVCIFYGWCAAVCAGCCAHPCELPGVSGSRPSSLLCSPRSVLLALLSSPVLLLCAQLSFDSFLNLFYSTDKGITSRKRL